MLITLCFFICSSLSTPDNYNALINDAIQKHSKFKIYVNDDNSTNPTQPAKKKFPFVPVIVSCAFIVIILIIALVYLCKKLKLMKNYTDVNKQEREMELITNQGIPNVLDNNEQNGIITLNEDDRKIESPDPEERMTEIPFTDEINTTETPNKEEEKPLQSQNQEEVKTLEPQNQEEVKTLEPQNQEEVKATEEPQIEEEETEEIQNPYENQEPK